MSRQQDRRGGHDRDDTRRHAASARPQLNEYFISSEGINRQVLQTEICKYLGSEATCRPGEYQGLSGFKIKALRPFTPDMLDDLREASKAFMNESRAYMKRHDRELPYTESKSYDQQNSSSSMDYDRPAFVGRDSPAYATSSANYPASSAPGFPSSSAGFGPQPLVSHAGMPYSSAPTAGYTQDHYSHPPPSRDPRDPRDAVMRDAQYSASYGGHAPSNFHPPGPYADQSYGGSRGADPRGDSRVNYGNDAYGGGYGGPPRRAEPSYETMQGLNGPAVGGGYGASAPSRGGAPYGDQHGYDAYARGAPIDSRYGRR